MKTSQFNLFYKKKNCVMGYNSYTDSFMLMSHKAYEAYKTVKLSDFEKQYPDIYRKLEDMKSLAHAQIPPHIRPRDAMDCGPTCLRMVARHYGRQWSLETLRQWCYITREGVTKLGISRAAESIGFRTLGAKLNMEQLTQQAPLPAILHWNQQHFVVLYRVTGHIALRELQAKQE